MLKQKFKQIILVFCSVFLIVFLFNLLPKIDQDIFRIGPGVAKAQAGQADEACSIHDDLSPNQPQCRQSRWLFEGVTVGGGSVNIGVWSLMLGLANAFVALVLFFFAFVNIAHIQYDTYQLKKVLPNLIIGIILANFSMLICRLMVDIASVLVVTFMQRPREIGQGIMTAFCYSSGNGFADLVTAGLTGLGGGALIFIVLMVIIIAIGILLAALLLWVRKTVLIILAAVAPVAFIMMAFPPTEQYFKKWWDWEIKYVFMGPIMLFLIWLAAAIGSTGCSHFSLGSMLTVVGLVYLSFIVPFLLGGAVMGAVNKLGKTAGKAAWNNPWSNRKKEMASNALKQRFYGGTRLGRWMERGARTDEAVLEAQRNEAETRQVQRDLEVNDRIGDRNAKAKEQLVRLKTELETAGNEKLAKHMQLNIDAITNTELASLKVQRAMDQIKKKGMQAAYKDKTRGEQLTKEDIEDARVNRELENTKKERMTEFYNSSSGQALVREEMDEEQATRDLERAKKNQRTEIYKSKSGEDLIANELQEVEANSNLEIARNRQTAKYYTSEKGREMAEMESNLANSQMQVEKIKDDQRVLMAQERLNGHEAMQESIKTYDESMIKAAKGKAAKKAAKDNSLGNAYKTVDTLTMQLAIEADATKRAKLTADLGAAEADLETKKKAFAAHLVANKGTDPKTGNVITTTQQAEDVINGSVLQRYERTRHMAIIGKRVNDDASVDAQSMSARAIASGLIDEKGVAQDGSYGPYTWTAQNLKDFFKGVRSKTGRAGSLGIATNLDSIKRHMQNNRTMGSALQQYVKIMEAGNPEAVEAHVSVAVDSLKRTNPTALTAIEDKINTNLGRPKGAAVTADEIKSYIKNNPLDTVSLNSPDNKFAQALYRSLQENDDEEITYTDSSGKTKTTRGFTGLGRQSHYYARKG